MNPFALEPSKLTNTILSTLVKNELMNWISYVFDVHQK